MRIYEPEAELKTIEVGDYEAIKEISVRGHLIEGKFNGLRLKGSTGEYIATRTWKKKGNSGNWKK